MKDKLEELLWIFDHSRRTRFLFWLGIVAFAVTLILGHVLTDRIELQGAFAPLTETVRDRLLRRYDAAAFGVLVTCWAAAVKCFIKDRRRLLGLR